MIKLSQLITEVIQLPPELDKESEILARFIGSFFIKYFERRLANIKTKSDPLIVKQSEYYRLANQYREEGKRLFNVEKHNESTTWGNSDFRIYSKNETLPDVILKVTDGYSISNDGYVNLEKSHAEIFLLVNTTHFVNEFKKSIENMTATLKHEILHCFQLSDPETGLLNKKLGMPKDRVMSKDADIYGNRDIHGYKTKYPHHMRDVEFKPNLHTYTYYIRNYLNKNYSINEWSDIFKKIISGKHLVGNEIIDHYSKNLGNMMIYDKARWEQFVKELYLMVFTK